MARPGDRDRKEGGGSGAKDLDALRAKGEMDAQRMRPRPLPGSLFLSMGPPARQGSGAAQAQAALAAAKAAADRASEAQEKADRAQDMLKAVRERMAAVSSRHDALQAAAGGLKKLTEAMSGTLEAALEAAAAAPSEAAPAAAAAEPSAAAPAGTAAAASQPPAASDAAAECGAKAGTSAPAAKAPHAAVPAASAAPTPAPLAAPQAPAPGARGEPSAAASKAVGPPLRRGDRISYVGRVHPGLAAAQERLDQLQAAMGTARSGGQSSVRDLLPQLLMRRSMLGAQKERAQRVQPSGAPPIGARGRVLSAAGDKVRRARPGRRGGLVDGGWVAEHQSWSVGVHSSSCSVGPMLWSQVQVVFDEPFTGGASLPGQRDKACLICAPEEVQVRGCRVCCSRGPGAAALP